MTVTTEISRATFPWTGVETSFACGFPADDVSHLRVFFRTNAGVTTQMTLGVNYNATLASGSKLATVTPVSFPASSGTVIVRRLTPAQVAEVLADGQEYSLAVIQALHDKAAMRSAEDRSTLARAIVLEEGVELGDGNFDLGGSGLSNVAPGSAPSDAATVGQLLDLLIAAGNVPSPLPGDVNKLLVSDGLSFSWQAFTLAMLASNFFTADANGLAKFADGFLSATSAGRAKMADGFLSADAAGRAKMDDDFVTSAEIAASALGPRVGMINGTLKTTRTGNAETFAVKTLAGADPSSGDPVVFIFQDGAGGYVRRRVTSALSVTASSGSTLGASNGVAFRIWCVAADDGGTVRLGLVKTTSVATTAVSVMALEEWSTYSSTAEGGAGAANSAQVIYSATAFTAKYLVLCGFADWDTGLATAGTWNTAPTRTVAFGPGVPRPGEFTGRRNQVVLRTTFTSSTTGALTDLTGLSASITPTSAANLVRAVPRVSCYVSGGSQVSIVCLRGSTQIGGGTAAGSRPSAIGGLVRVSEVNSIAVINAEVLDAPGAITAQNYKVQFGLQSNTFYVNRTETDTDAVQIGRYSSSITLEEVMA